jgi:transposase-like protein
MATTNQPKTLLAAIKHYSNPDVCQAELVAARWPDGVTCPTCGGKDVSYLANQRRWQCRAKHARRQFSVKVGTIFEDSPIGLDKWFVAIWLIANAKNGISSYELHRALGVTQKTGWFMLHRIRLAMQTRSFRKMTGHVEVDETYIGGKARNMHAKKRREIMGEKANRWAGKVAVMGLLERGANGESRVVTMPVQNVRQHRLHGTIAKHVEKGTNVYTDALPSYRNMSDFEHKFIDHAHKYVDGLVHTNGMESFWAMLKRSLYGTYISVEPFHLFRYLDEQSYRFNNRKGVDSGRFAGVLRTVTGRRVMYSELTGKEAGAA